MKVLHVTETIDPVGGIETYVIALTQLLQSHGHRNAIVCRGRQTPVSLRGTRVFFVPRTQSVKDELRQFLEILDEEDPHVALLHVPLAREMQEAISQRSKTVAYLHSFHPVCPGLRKYFVRGERECTKSLSMKCIPNIYLRRCATARHPNSVLRIMRRAYEQKMAYLALDRIIVASTYMKNLLIQNGFQTNQITVLPPHFDYPRPFISPTAKIPQVLFAGRLETEKGIPCLLRALRRIATPCKLILAGDGSCRSEYQSLARSLGLADKVAFAGWLEKGSLDQAYTDCSVAVMTSLWPEPFGKVGVEALAHGRPVVAFDVGGIPDWLTDGRNGFLVPPGNERLLASRIEDLLKNPARAQELGARGLRDVAEKYSSSSHLERLLKVLEDAPPEGTIPASGGSVLAVPEAL